MRVQWLKTKRWFKTIQPRRLLLFCILLDMIGVGLIIPCVSQLILSLGATPTQYGILSSLYGLGQVVGSPFSGFLSDRYGRKPVLLLSLFGSCAGYFCLGIAWGLPLVVIARVAVGLVKQTFTTGTAFMAELTTPKQRTSAMASMNMMAGLGFIIGPILGSLLARFVSLRVPFLLSAFVFLLDLLLAWLLLPNVAISSPDPLCPVTGKPGFCPAAGLGAAAPQPAGTIDYEEEEAEEDNDETTEKETLIEAEREPPTLQGFLSRSYEAFAGTLGTFSLISQVPGILRVMVHSTLLQASMILLESTMLVFLQKRFDMDSKSNGFVLAYFGVLGVFTSSVLVGPAIGALGEERSVTLGFTVAGLGCTLCAVATSLRLFLLGVGLFAVGLYVAKACLAGIFTQLAPPIKRGAFLGANGFLESLCRVTLPAVGGFVMAQGWQLPYALCAALLFSGVYGWTVTGRVNIEVGESVKKKQK